MKLWMIDLGSCTNLVFAALASVVLRWFGAAAIAIVLSVASWSPAQAADAPLIFAAASLKEVVEEIADAFGKQTGIKVKLAFAATSSLARQIAHGAPAEAFISADQAWVDWLAQNNMIDRAAVREIARNRLVVAVGGDNAGVNGLPATGRVAMAEIESVPAGRYAAQALNAAGWWQQIAPRAIYAENVRVALAMVRRGQASAAIVYRTDALAVPELAISHEFADGSHDPVRYLATPVKGAGEKAARFVDFAANAGEIFVRHGFLPAITVPQSEAKQ